MKTQSIKFSNGLQNDFNTVLRTNIRNYFEENQISKYGNVSMVLKSIFMLSIYIIPYLLLVTHTIVQPFAVFLLWILMGCAMAGIGFSIMHDANHKAYSRRKWVNTILGYMLNVVGGFMPIWLIQHNILHHGYTNIDNMDEDIDPGKIMRISPNKPHYPIYRFQHIYAWFFYGLMTLSWVVDKDFRQLYRYRREGLLSHQQKSFALLLTELFLSKAFYFAYILVIPLIFFPGPWWFILIGFFSMHFVCGLFLTIIFQLAHVVPTSNYPTPDTSGNIESSWAVHQLLTTSDFSPRSILLSWFIGGLNYQIEHHLFPNICHVHYKKLSIIVRETALKFGLPYHVQPTLLTAVINHGRMLKQLGR